MTDKPKILWLSDSTLNCTGYANQTFNILNFLSDDYDTHQLCHNYVGYSIPPGLTLKDGTKYNFWLHGCGKEQYCKDVMIPKIRELPATFFGILLDTFMLYPWLTQMDFAPAKSFFYFPSDGGAGMPLGCDAILRKMSFAVAMSKYAQKQVKDYYNIDCYHIPHGVDCDNFFPLSLSDKLRLKSESVVYMMDGANYSAIKGVLSDKFVIGVVARNQGRKMLDRTFKVMHHITRMIPNAVLFMHTDPFDAAGVFNMSELINRFNLQGKVFFSGMNFFKGTDYKDMNNIYNLMDVFLLTTSGEGWGIPTVEAMACGVVPVVTDYTTTKEILVDGLQCGLPIRLVGTESFTYSDDYSLKEFDKVISNGTITGNWNVERGVCDVRDAAYKIKMLYDKPGLMMKFKENGRKKALEQYSWKVVIPQWKKLLSEQMKK
jgi:glycosyltransferase involved in cell wall biosynthesis